MKRTVRLRTNEGHALRIALEHWGSGLDHTLRRWTLADSYWECMGHRRTCRGIRAERLMVFNGWS